MRSENFTILVAEDHEESRELLRVFLEGEGFRVVEAENVAPKQSA
jgi:CheY-like chemotaxis protein